MAVMPAVVRDQRDKEQGQHHGGNSSKRRAREVIPNRGGDSERNGGSQHDVRSSEMIQQGNEQEASGGRPHQIEKIHAIDALNALANCQGHHGARKKERQCARQIDFGKCEIGELAPARQDEDQREQHHQAVQNGQRAQPEVELFARLRDHIREQSARAESEQGDRNCEKSKVIVKDDGEDASERQLEQERGQGGKRHAQIKLRPSIFAGKAG